MNPPTVNNQETPSNQVEANQAETNTVEQPPASITIRTPSPTPTLPQTPLTLMDMEMDHPLQGASTSTSTPAAIMVQEADKEAQWKGFLEWKKLYVEKKHQEAKEVLDRIKKLRDCCRRGYPEAEVQKHLITWDPYHPWKTLPKKYWEELNYNPDLKRPARPTPYERPRKKMSMKQQIIHLVAAKIKRDYANKKED